MPIFVCFTYRKHICKFSATESRKRWNIWTINSHVIASQLAAKLKFFRKVDKQLRSIFLEKKRKENYDEKIDETLELARRRWQWKWKHQCQNF